MDIKSIRMVYGLTQQAMSDLTGIPKRSIENWEAGSRTPPPYLPNLIRICLEHTLRKEP